MLPGFPSTGDRGLLCDVVPALPDDWPDFRRVEQEIWHEGVVPEGGRGRSAGECRAVFLLRGPQNSAEHPPTHAPRLPEAKII